MLALQLLKENGFKGYIVGGAIRDYLMNKEPHDIDITTDASKTEIIKIFKNYRTVDVGTEFGTVLVFIIDIPLEITPHRSESNYLDHRHPANVTFVKDLREDLSRRDFTINAIAYSPDTSFIDYFNGKEDIDHKIIRTVGDADLRFNEDALRILRGIRFASTLGFEIEDHTDSAIHNNKDLLKYISMERKIIELKKILSSNVHPFLNNYLDVLNTFVSFKETDEITDKFNNWILKFSYLLNDSFADRLSSLKLSNDEIKLIKTLIRAKTVNFDDDYLFVKTVSETAFKSELLSFKSVLDEKDYELKRNLLKDRIIDELYINGYDLMELGYLGKDIREILNKLKDAVYHGYVKNRKSSLLEYLKNQI